MVLPTTPRSNGSQAVLATSHGNLELDILRRISHAKLDLKTIPKRWVEQARGQQYLALQSTVYPYYPSLSEW
jgi:hypothetical protein